MSNRKVAKKVPPVSGEPVEAYTRIILDAINRYYEDVGFLPTSFTYRVDSISLSNCTEDQKDSAFRPISSFLGGILDFFNDAALDCKGYNVIQKYEEISRRTCIRCGKPATMITTGWISPYCDDCVPEHNGEKKRAAPIEEFFSKLEDEMI